MASTTRSLCYAGATALALLTILSPRSQKARMYLNAFIYSSSLGIASFLGLLISTVLNFIPSQKYNNYYIIARLFYAFVGTLVGIRFEVEGEENFAKARPAVIVANHQSSMDIILLGRIFPKSSSIMAKREVKFLPLLGQWMYFSGSVFVDRKNRGDAIKTFDQVGKVMKKDDFSLWIFPEGTRSKLPVPDLLPFKKGAFHLALQAQLPVVAVVCENYHRLFDSKTRFESGTIRIKVLPPVETKGMTSADVNTLIEKVRGQMLAALLEMDADRQRFDTSSMATDPPSSLDGSKPSLSVGSNIARDERGLGGIAGWMAKIVGTGPGRNTDRKAARDAERLKVKGSTGERPEDYHLISEAERKKMDTKSEGQEGASATATEQTQAREGLVQRKASAAGSGSGDSDETEGSTVLVEAPQ